jgi:hypothetical protein
LGGCGRQFAGQRINGAVYRRSIDEYVDVDVDRAPRPPGAPCKGECTAEGMRQLGRAERIVKPDDLLGQCDAHAGRRKSRSTG